MIVVQHEADLGLVHAHAERRGRHHDVQLALHEPLLHLVPLRGRHPAVVRLGGDVAVAEQAGELHGVLAGGDVDDTRAASLGIADELRDDADGQSIAILTPGDVIEAEDQVVAYKVAHVGSGAPPVPMPSDAVISCCTCAVAVAVRAWTGSGAHPAVGKSRAMSRKSGRKSWPQVAMQWASSTTSCTSGSCGR